MVSAADRNLDRGLNLLHGPREHCWKQNRAPVDHHLWIWFGAWLRLLVRPPRNTAVRWLTPSDLVTVFQPRCRAWPDSGLVAVDSKSRTPLPVHCGRTHRHDYSFHNHRPHRVALDDGTR